jgi:hypothetical protein
VGGLLLIALVAIQGWVLRRAQNVAREAQAMRAREREPVFSEDDALLKIQRDKLARHEWDFSDQSSSVAVNRFKDAKARVPAFDLFSKRDYSSLFHLCWDLHVQGRKQDEFAVLSQWLAVRPEGVPLGDLHPSGDDLYHFLNYLEQAYLTSIPAYVRSHRYEKAAQLAQDAVRRIRLVRPPPLDRLDQETNARISRILLLGALLTDGGVVPGERQAVKRLVSGVLSLAPEIYGSELASIDVDPPSATSDLGPGLVPVPSSRLGHFFTFLNGVHLFRAYRYREAAHFFGSVESSNREFMNVTRLMRARSAFWSVKDPKAVGRGPDDSAALVGPVVLEMAEALRKTPYEDDLAEYVRVISSATDGGGLR